MSRVIFYAEASSCERYYILVPPEDGQKVSAMTNEELHSYVQESEAEWHFSKHVEANSTELLDCDLEYES
jgi:hypothetical protein